MFARSVESKRFLALSHLSYNYDASATTREHRNVLLHLVASNLQQGGRNCDSAFAYCNRVIRNSRQLSVIYGRSLCDPIGHFERTVYQRVVEERRNYYNHRNESLLEGACVSAQLRAHWNVEQNESR